MKKFLLLLAGAAFLLISGQILASNCLDNVKNDANVYIDDPSGTTEFETIPNGNTIIYDGDGRLSIACDKKNVDRFSLGTSEEGDNKVGKVTVALCVNKHNQQDAPECTLKATIYRFFINPDRHNCAFYNTKSKNATAELSNGYQVSCENVHPENGGGEHGTIIFHIKPKGTAK